MPDDAVTLFNGRGGEYAARIERINKDEVAVSITGFVDIECESRLRIVLAQGISSGERMDYTLQKAVELGVAAIQPIAAKRSVVKLAGERADRRVAHWQGVVASACEQCGRNQVPLVAPVERLENWLARPVAEGTLRLMLAPDAEMSFASIRPTGPVQLLIGAEGGLDPQEMIAAQQAGFQAVRMGPRVLRTETAGLAALAVMQAMWGDFRGE